MPDLDIRIDKGVPTDDELAALTAVLYAMAAANDSGETASVVSLATWRRRDTYRLFDSPASWRRVS